MTGFPDPLMALESGSIKSKFLSLTYQYLKESEVIFVGVPIITWPYFHQSSIYPFDIFFVSSINEFNKIKDCSLHENTLNFGCPSLDYKYLVSKTSLDNNQDNDRDIALLIAVNNTNPAFSDWPQLDETNKITQALVESGFSVLIKVHPRSDKQFRKNLNLNKYINVTNESIKSAIDSSALVVSYLSTGIFVAIAKKVPTLLYIPRSLTYNQGFQRGTFAKELYFESYEDNSTRIDTFCTKVTNISELVEKSNTTTMKSYTLFEKQFNPNGASKRIVDYFLDNYKRDSN